MGVMALCADLRGRASPPLLSARRRRPVSELELLVIDKTTPSWPKFAFYVVRRLQNVNRSLPVMSETLNLKIKITRQTMS